MQSDLCATVIQLPHQFTKQVFVLLLLLLELLYGDWLLHKQKHIHRITHILYMYISVNENTYACRIICWIMQTRNKCKKCT